MRDSATPLRGKDRIELPVTFDGTASTLAAWKSHSESGDCITVGLVKEDGIYEIASVGTSSILDAASEVLISSLPGNMDVLGPHVLTSFSPSSSHVTVDAMLYDERGGRKDVSAEGRVKVGPDTTSGMLPQVVGPDIDGFVKMLCSALRACSEDELSWVDDLRIEVIHGKGRTYLAEGDRLTDVTGNSLLYVCRQVVDMLVAKYHDIKKRDMAQDARRASAGKDPR